MKIKIKIYRPDVLFVNDSIYLYGEIFDDVTSKFDQ